MGEKHQPEAQRGTVDTLSVVDPLRLNGESDAHLPVLLIADDDEDILTLVHLRLSRSGFDIVVARDGEEALRLVRECRPDLAVLDWMMPKMNGIDVLREIRGGADTASIPVVLLTARVSDADMAEGFAAGADGYVAKPFSPQELASRVQAILAG
jgi:DNA-binding response OmpR family regulator